MFALLGMEPKTMMLISTIELQMQTQLKYAGS